MEINQFKLISKQDNETICIPEGETTLGRGPFLKVRDKKVSRAHAIISFKCGSLQIKPVHSNPTFFYEKSANSFVALKKDTWKELHGGDTISLLPDSQIFVIAAIPKNKDNSTDEFANTNNQTLDDSIESLGNNDRLDIEKAQNTLSPSNEVKNVDASKEVNVPILMTFDASIDSLDSDGNDRLSNVKDGACSSSLAEENEPRSVNVPPKSAEVSRPKQESAKTKKRILPSWMTESPAKETSPTPANKKMKAQHASVEKDCVNIPKTESPCVEENKSLEERENEVEKDVTAKNEEEDNNENEEESVHASKEVKDVATKNKEEDHTNENQEEIVHEKKKLPKCQYGKSCYRQNPLHLEAFSHSDNERSDDENNANESSDKPECPYGTSCYRKNPEHKAAYKHTKPPAAANVKNIRRSTRKRKRKSVLTGDSDDDGENNYDFDDSFIDDDDQSSSTEDDDGSEDLEELLQEAEEIKQSK
eukprot:gene20257-22241_t